MSAISTQGIHTKLTQTRLGAVRVVSPRRWDVEVPSSEE